jgi:hypothetical protein
MGRKFSSNIFLIIAYGLTQYYAISLEVKKLNWSVKKDRAVLVTSTSTLPHFLDNELKDGDGVVSPKRRTTFGPQEDSW